jgi:glutamyl-tRNA reductase
VIGVVGLSHRSAPIEVRERLALAEPKIVSLLERLVEQPEIGEAMLVSTCNRVEVVVAGRSAETSLETIVRVAADLLETEAPGIGAHLYRHAGGDAVRHLFRVACSLDSLVVGEPQILGQLKDAYELARNAGTVGSALHRTVPRALRTAKRVRTETAVGRGQVSVPSVAIDLAREIFGDLAGRSALLVGSGEMAESVARLLRGAGAKLVVCGRNLQRVTEVAQAVDGSPLQWQGLGGAIAHADVVVTSTSAPGYVVEHATLAGLKRQRRGRSLFFIDLAVPRDVDPAAQSIDGVFVYNIDDLSRVVAETHSVRQREAERAEEIVAEETAGWRRWADAEQATPAIVALRTRWRAIVFAELEKTLQTRLKHLGADEREAIEKMLDAALNKLLHGPTLRLRQAATERSLDGVALDQLMTALRELFAPEEPDAPMDADTDAGAERNADAKVSALPPGARATGTGR